MAGVITKSVADKPLQWLGVVAVLGGGAYLLYKKLGKSKEKKTELTDSKENPFSYTTFLSQKIPENTSLLTWSQANSYAKTIYDSLNTYFNDSEGICVGAFKTIPSKVKVAQVSRNFYALYKRDILEYLKNGNKTFDFGTGGVSSSKYSDILEMVKNKSKF
jgi:hypothetical protein